jgi:hypothetical protein
MTPEEFAAKMAEYKALNEGDPEASHSLADGLMCKALRELGYGDGIDMFETMTTWCA